MAVEQPYTPEFPYSGKQIIISSGRVTLHSKDDSIFLFGKKAIALSSLGSVNMDITNRLIVNAPKIELGLEAERFGQPLVLGNTYVELTSRLLDSLTKFGKALSEISETELETAVPVIVNTGKSLALVCPELKAALSGSLSNVTYTK